MNRRELFKGLAASLAAASIPIPALLSLPDTEILRYLKRVRLDLLDKIANPPRIMHEDGRTEMMSTEVQQEALRHVVALIEELC